MMLDEGEKEPFLPTYDKDYDPRISYAVGNRDIGLLFGQRGRFSLMWRLYTNVKSEIVLRDEMDVDHVLGEIKGIVNLSFTFDPFSYPIVSVQVEREDFTGVEIYKFINSGGDIVNKVLLLSLPDCRCPKMLTSNVSNLGSILNQPLVVYIDELGNISQRSMKTNFTVLDGLPKVLGLSSSDELRRAGITNTGKVQLEISKVKQPS